MEGVRNVSVRLRQRVGIEVQAAGVTAVMVGDLLGLSKGERFNPALAVLVVLGSLAYGIGGWAEKSREGLQSMGRVVGLAMIGLGVLLAATGVLEKDTGQVGMGAGLVVAGALGWGLTEG